MSKMKFKLMLCVACMLALFSTGCSSSPDDPVPEPKPEPKLVELNLSLKVDNNREMLNLSKSRASNNKEDYDVRWKVEIYKEAVEGTPVFSKVLKSEMASDFRNTLNIKVPSMEPAKYCVVAWMDYTDKGKLDDKFYAINDLSKVTIPEAGKYEGNTIFKDAFVGTHEFDLVDKEGSVDCPMTLSSPLAKIELYSTDVDKFIASLGESAPKSLQITLEYACNLPVSYNAYSEKANDAKEGMYFVAEIPLTSSSETEIASDYIFATGVDGEAVVVNMRIDDKEGTNYSTVQSLRIPVKRGCISRITESFLEKSFSPGIEIDPDFEGNNNIDLDKQDK